MARKPRRANQLEARFIRIPDEGHGGRKPKNQFFPCSSEIARMLSS